MEEMQTGLETPKETSKNMETGDVPKKKLSKKLIYGIAFLSFHYPALLPESSREKWIVRI